jgi:hypothetical protein
MVGDKERSCTLIVVEDIDVPLLLGQDFLEEHQVTLNCGQGIVWYGDEKVPTMPVKRQVRKRYRATKGVGLAIEEALVLEPNQVATVRCTILENTQRWSPGWAWVVDPIRAVYGMGALVPDALVEYRGERSVILAVMNLSEEKISLESNTLVGTLRTLPEDTTIRAVRLAGDTSEEVGKMPEPEVIEVSRAKLTKVVEENFVKNPNLTERQKEEFLCLLLKYKDVLCADHLGTVEGTMFDIDVGGAKPIRQRDRRWSQV